LTEVPEHLLKRSRDRRAALGLGGGDAGGAEAPEPSAPSSSAVEPAAPATPEPAAPATPAEVAPPEPEPVPHYVEAHQRRKKVPAWAVPVIAALPFWGAIYVGTLESPPQELTGPVAEGSEIYVAACAGCHGGGGGGGVGRQLNEGEVLLTFPNWEDHVAFVEQGTAGYLGEVVGDPDRPGGPHIGGSFGVMAAQSVEYGGALTEEEILAVVAYERVTHGGEDPETSELVAFIEGGEGGAEEAGGE
jgi:mono/diheme cytochrome c family protein